MVSFRNLILVLSILVLDYSLFYSQLLGASFMKEDQGYVANISGGNARQFSDVSSDVGGWNGSLSIGKNIYYDEYSTFSFDLLANMSLNITKGLDGIATKSPFENSVLDNTDYKSFFYNYKTTMFSIGLDGKLNYNRARTDQRWYVSLIPGLNIGFFGTKMDLKDANGNYYNQQFNDLIKLNLSQKSTKKQLRNILDYNYETKAEGFGKFPIKAKIMPSLGLEVEYDITDYLSIFLMDKIYYSNSNEIDAQSNIDDSKDFINFLNLGASIYFLPSKSSRYSHRYDRATNDKLNTNGYKIPKEVQDHNYPEVKIIQPSDRPYKSTNDKVFIKAKINNIKSALNVKCKVNGKEVQFEFDEQFVTFFAPLEPGDNRVQVYVKNDFGQSRDAITIMFGGDRHEVSEPEIQLIAPSKTVFYSDDEIYTIKARIHYLDSDNHIQLLANGQPFKSYKFNEKTSEFKIKVRLAEGLNNFVLSATNEEGKAISSFDIYYKVNPDQNKDNNGANNGNGQVTGDTPKISFISPDSKISYLNGTDLLELKARVQGVNSSSDITITVNERPIKYFNFEASTGLLSDKISLYDDVSTIKIVARNKHGVSTKDLTVYLDKEPPKSQENKIIVFNNVDVPDKDCKTSIEAKINKSVSKRNIKLFLNQFEIKNFLFESSRGILKSSLYLDEGQNTIKIALNANGQEYIEEYKMNCGLVQNDNTLPNETINLPAIDVFYPKNNLNIENDVIRLKANVKYVESKTEIEILLNNNPIQDFDFDAETGEIFAQLELNEGINKLYIKASNAKGESENEVSFSYEIPIKYPPGVLINSPRNGFKSEKNIVVFRASIENVSSREDIYVTLNGDDYSDFNYDEKLGIVFSNLPLKLGKNTLKVEAENKLGMEYDEVTFEYRSKVVPAVEITSPKNGIIMSVAYVPIRAVVQNVERKSDVQITVNGSRFNSLSLDGDNLVSKVRVKQGRNEIIIKAVNDYGMSSDTLVVSFNGKPQKPTIELENPKKSGGYTSSRQLEFLAKVEGISHSSFVDLTLNGRDVTNLRYIRDKKMVKANLQLKKGWNTIIIKASNKSGSTTRNTKIFLE